MSGTANHLFGFKTNRVSGYFEPIEPTKADQLVLPKTSNMMSLRHSTT